MDDMKDKINLAKNEQKVLSAIYASNQRNDDPDNDALAKMTGLSADEVTSATRSLYQRGFIAPMNPDWMRGTTKPSG
jgi:DNA-binding MarR family transcriptional regulator